jgi:transcriptional regulator with XRE-family HTH domain
MRVGTVNVDGKKIRHLRKFQGWTQDDLARKTGCSKKTIENVEAGKRALLYTLNCLAQVFRVPREDLLLPDFSPLPNQPTRKPTLPFSWRTSITDGESFFNREREQHVLQKLLLDRQCCQIVGPRRIGKSSLLRQIERMASAWDETAVVAYLDLQNPRCFTLAGLLEHTCRQFGFPAPGIDLARFSENFDMMVDQGRQPILCLDEFEELTWRRSEFSRDFYTALRSCGQKPMSIVTASQSRLRDLTDPNDPSSPFYNIFPPLDLGPFDEEDAGDFVNIARAGIPAFTAAERKRILEFSRGHPLALQVACYHVLDARETGESLAAAIQNAETEMRCYLPQARADAP